MKHWKDAEIWLKSHKLRLIENLHTPSSLLPLLAYCMSPSFACCCQPHTAYKQWLSPACCCQPHITIAYMHCYQLHGAHKQCPSLVHHHHLHITVGHMVPLSSAYHLHIAIACASPFALSLAAWCPWVMPVTCTSLSPTCHHQLHGAPEQYPSPTYCCCLYITVDFVLPLAA